MKIVIINKEPLETIPPLISVIETLIKLGHEISIITGGINENYKIKLNEKGIDSYIIPFEKNFSVFQKIQSTIKFRKMLEKYLEAQKNDLVWVEGGGVYRFAYDILEKYPLVMQISELFDTSKTKPVHKAIGKIIHKACAVVMPELNRATLYQVEYGLRERPIVLPNKPYFYLTKEDEIRCKKKYEKELKVFKEKKVILYQGIIHKERDLTNYVKAVKELGNDYQLVLLGADYGVLDDYRRINSEIVHIDFIPAPDYLFFTSHAYMGIVTYEPTTLNCAYCAPNKIYEYGKYSLPMLFNDIPGLIYTIGYANAGVVVNEKSVESIKEGILKIDKNYSEYARNAEKFYDDTENVATIKRILEVAIANKK